LNCLKRCFCPFMQLDDAIYWTPQIVRRVRAA
jgi:hypothetical protein